MGPNHLTLRAKKRGRFRWRRGLRHTDEQRLQTVTIRRNDDVLAGGRGPAVIVPESALWGFFVPHAYFHLIQVKTREKGIQTRI